MLEAITALCSSGKEQTMETFIDMEIFLDFQANRMSPIIKIKFL